MQPIPFKQSNLNLGAGDNPNTDDMPVAVSVNPEMSEGQPIPFIVSCWKLSKEEIEQLNRTGELWVSTMGVQPPPIALMVHNPFTEHGYKAYDISELHQ